MRRLPPTWRRSAVPPVARPGGHCVRHRALSFRGFASGATRDLARALRDGAAARARHSAQSGGHAGHAGCAGRRLTESISGGCRGGDRRAGADRGHAARSGRTEAAHAGDGGASRQHRGAGNRTGGTDGRAGTKLRRAGDKARSDAGTEDAETEQRERRQHQRHGLADVRLLSLERGDELAEETRADADDDRQHHHLDAGRDDIAQHALGEERGLVPEREGHQDETGERRQLELEDGDEELDRQNEEGQDHDGPGDQQHDDGQEVVEEVW